jgi:hypothetical protein
MDEYHIFSNLMNLMKSDNIDLLSVGKARQRWIPQRLRRQDCWKVFSGKWMLELPDKIMYCKDSKVSIAENASVIGSHEWNGYSLKVSFRILSGSIKPPEGGVIIFFHFQDINNHYSFHFCLFKQKIELIKKHRGIWTTIAAQEYTLETGKDYLVSVTTGSGVHQCAINGINQIKEHDGDLSQGCIGLGAKYCDTEFNHVSISLH